MTKTMIRVFTISDFEDEENWLREMHKQGWKLSSFVTPFFYRFVSCTPEDVIYRLDYTQKKRDQEYLQMMQDYGWEYFEEYMGWMYFRKPASEAVSEEDGELFSDNASRIERVSHIVKTRLIPICIIFFTCLIPNIFNAARFFGVNAWGTFFGIFFFFLFAIYIWMITHCGLKLKKMRQQLEN